MRPSIKDQYDTSITRAFAKRTPAAEPVLADSDIAHMPAPAQRYLRLSGVVGKPRPWNMRVEFDAEMRKKPGARPMEAVSEQYSFFDDPTRIFAMKARMFGLPVRVLHQYQEQKATMLVRVAGIFTVADVSGPELDQAETVTVLNDMCILAPGSLADRRLAWRPIDDTSTEVTFTNGVHSVKAVLCFDGEGELRNFVSDDRYALGDDKTLRKFRFSTPVKDHRDYGGIRLASYGEAVWHYPEGEFAYGKFTLKSVSYNVAK